MELVSFRLESGADIRRDLEHLVKRDNILAAVVMGAVGSLSNVCLRFAGQNRHTTLSGNSYEILTLSGTLGEGGVHLHMSVADSLGECKGGHVVYGCRVNTTLELVIALLPDVSFLREMDEKTGYKELKVTQLESTLETSPKDSSSNLPEALSEEASENPPENPPEEKIDAPSDQSSPELSDELSEELSGEQQDSSTSR